MQPSHIPYSHSLISRNQIGPLVVFVIPLEGDEQLAILQVALVGEVCIEPEVIEEAQVTAQETDERLLMSARGESRR